MLTYAYNRLEVFASGSLNVRKCLSKCACKYFMGTLVYHRLSQLDQLANDY